MTPEVNKAICQVLDSQRGLLSEAITTRQYEAEPELAIRYGEAGKNHCLQDANYHLLHLAESVAASSPALFSDYIAWARVMLQARGVPTKDLSRNLVIIQEVVREKLPPELATAIDEYFEAGLNRLPSPPANLTTMLDGGRPHHALAAQFLKQLLNGERQVATRLILDAVDSGVSIKDIYLHVFQATQRELGRLWQLNQISVAQEHYCTAATQLIMAQLYPRILCTQKNGRKMVATSVGGELHEIGIRIVTEFFEMEGWDSYYLGANSPTTAIVQAIADRRADVLAVSATMTFHVRAVENLISTIRSAADMKSIKVLVGGYPFNREPELWKRLGADGFATDASEAIAVASEL